MKRLVFAVALTLFSLTCNAAPQQSVRCESSRTAGVGHVVKICSIQRVAENFCTCVTFDGEACSGACLNGKPVGCACK